MFKLTMAVENETARLRVALSLTKSYTTMIHLLMHRAEVTREQMALALWNGYPRHPRSLNVMICNLRVRLHQVDPRITILTIPRTGWKLSTYMKALITKIVDQHFNKRASDKSHARGPAMVI